MLHAEQAIVSGIIEETTHVAGYRDACQWSLTRGYNRIAGKIRVPLKAGEKFPLDANTLLEGDSFLPTAADRLRSGGSPTPKGGGFCP